jgi:hypothetical protein
MDMKSKISSLPFAMLIFLFACPVSVTAAGSDKQIITAESIQISCYESSKYFVITKEVLGKSGSDCLIKSKSTPDEKLSCEYTFGTNDFEIKNEWAEYFAGLKGDLLILDSSTGPGPSGLTIWDLNKRKKVYEGSWSDPEDSTDDALIFWLETEEASDDNCPELKEWKSLGLEGAIETKVILNLTDFEISKTQTRRCSPRQ